MEKQERTRSVEEIIEGLNIPRVKKTPTGYTGCCTINPNHKDRSPSMSIHIDKGMVKCFACGTFKTLFDFLIENGATFEEAINFMFISHHRDTRDPNELEEYVLGRKIPKSLIDKGLSVKTLKHFGVGYDEWEQRITIPMKYNGKLYGVGYRQVLPNGKRRIWATDGFNKDNFIYNYEPTECRIYVEGYTDLWAVWQNGSHNVSSTLSANVSEGQMSLILNHKEIWLAFDNDKAGYSGMFKIYKELGRDVDIMVIPYNGKDPAELSESEWQEAINNRTTFIEFELALLRNNPDLYNEIIKQFNKKEYE